MSSEAHLNSMELTTPTLTMNTIEDVSAHKMNKVDIENAAPKKAEPRKVKLSGDPNIANVVIVKEGKCADAL